jgi:hypothetical protein
VLQSARLVACSRSRPRRARTVATRGLETRLPAILEPHDLRARHRLRPGSDPYEMEMHVSLLSGLGRTRGKARTSSNRHRKRRLGAPEAPSD